MTGPGFSHILTAASQHIPTMDQRGTAELADTVSRLLTTGANIPADNPGNDLSEEN